VNERQDGARQAATRAPTSTPARRLAIAAPLAGATYLIDSTLRREFQTLSLQAQGAAAGTSLEWLVNGATVGTVEAGGTLRWPLVRGTHVITVRDASGQRAQTRVEVR
jgi:membrane carboxypeptidase/penicillin-binding protein PbpC